MADMATDDLNRTRGGTRPSSKVDVIADVIAIDGPVATGKTVVGLLLAERMGYRFLDTGTMYRAVTWLAMSQGVDLDDEDALADLARHAEIEVAGRDGRAMVNGSPAPLEERRAEIDKRVSLVARVPGVRTALVEKQRRMAEEGGIVLAGRDIGTVVAPDAPLKLYFQASAEERAKRRYEELRRAGHPVEFNRVLEETLARDKLDSERANSPLRPAADARLIDSEGLTVADVVERIMEMIEQG